MRVLVTGGAGFIGSHIVEVLLDGGADVRVVDSLDPSVHGPAATANGAAADGTAGGGVAAGGLDRRAELLVGDLGDPAVAGAAVDGVDAVCHQAAKVGLGVDFGDVTGYVAGNDTATAVLLEALWRNGFGGRLVLASSMVVYGEGLARCAVHGPVAPAARLATDVESGCFEPGCPRPGCPESVTWTPVEESAPADPRNVYAATKLHQEHLCSLWGRAAGATVVALRYHNVYGPRMPRDTPYAGVASIFRSALAAGRPALVFEDGGQTRDFVHVRDVARANVLALCADVASGAYNIASGTPHTVLDMATALTDAFGPNAPRPMINGGWRPGDVRHIVASPRKAAEELGFMAGIGFEEGMAEFAHAPQRRAIAATA
jgi:dTDP-L-rhamnose 4-epimerase